MRECGSFIGNKIVINFVYTTKYSISNVVSLKITAF